MRNNRNITSNHLIVGSFLLMVLSVMAFRFYYNPPKVTNVFRPERPAGLSFSIPDMITVNDPFEVTVEVDTKNQEVNAVGIYLNYDTSKLRLLDFDTSDSFCQFYPEKRFDETLGKIMLACGAPHPGVAGRNNIMTLQFLPLQAGAAQITTDPKSQVLLSNGKGTNVLTEFPSGKVNVVNSL